MFGEDVELAIFGDTRGLLERFGRDRIRNTPICEATLAGMAVGAAAAGYRVVLHMMFSNFLYTGFDAIANQMAKLRLMTGGQLELPITIMSGYGGGRSNAAQHSDTPHSLLMNLGGVNVAVPATPVDAKGLLKTAIRGRNPTFFMEASGRGGGQWRGAGWRDPRTAGQGRDCSRGEGHHPRCDWHDAEAGSAAAKKLEAEGSALRLWTRARSCLLMKRRSSASVSARRAVSSSSTKGVIGPVRPVTLRPLSLIRVLGR